MRSQEKENFRKGINVFLLLSLYDFQSTGTPLSTEGRV